MEIRYKVGDFKRLVAESSNEFRPVIGAGVEKDNKENNGKAYKEAKSRAKDYNGGLSKEIGEEKPEYEKNDANRTTLDVNPENVSDEYKKRIKAQAEGYTSEMEKNNGIEKAGDFSDNGNIYDAIKKTGKEIHKNVSDFKASGVRARALPKGTFDREELYEERSGEANSMRNMIDALRNTIDESRNLVKEKKVPKTVYFKKTVFINESYMKSRIPDEFKKEGTEFIMKDRNGTEYLVEWKNGGAEVLSSKNQPQFDDAMDKFRRLSEYNGSDYSRSTASERLHENRDEFDRILNITRQKLK